MMPLQASHPLTSRVLLSSASQTPAASFLPLLASCPPDLLLSCPDSASPLPLHSSLAHCFLPTLSSLLPPSSSPWDAPTPASLSLPDSSHSLLSRLLSSLYSPSSALTFSSSETPALASLLQQLGVQEQRYSVQQCSLGCQHGAMEAEDDRIVDTISDMLEESFSEADIENMINASGKMELEDIERLLEEGEERGEGDTLGEKEVKERLSHLSTLKEGDKSPSPGQIIWQKELEAAGYDPRIRRCSVTVQNLPDKTLRDFIAIAKRNLEGKRIRINLRRKEQQERNRKRRRLGKAVGEEEDEEGSEGVGENTENVGKKIKEDIDHEVTFKAATTTEDVTIIDDVTESSVLKALENDFVKKAQPKVDPSRVVGAFSSINKMKPKEQILNKFEFPQINIVKVTKKETSLEEQQPEIEFLEAREVECPDCPKQFTARAKLLGHLVTVHYSQDILRLHPYTTERGGLPCVLCIASGRAKSFQIKDRSSHLRHLGQSHEVVLQVVRDEVKDIVALFTKMTRRRSKARTLDDSRDSFPDASSQDIPTIRIKPEPVEIKEEYSVPEINIFQELDKLEKTLETTIQENTEVSEKQAMINALKEKKAAKSKDLNCADCKLNFESESELQHHIVQYKKVHSKVYKCRYCEVSSVGTRNFKDHLMSHKNEQKDKILA